MTRLLFAVIDESSFPWARAVTHRHLAAALSTPATPLRADAFSGLPTVAFAARVAVRRPGEYGALLASAEQRIAAVVERLLAWSGCWPGTRHS